MERYIQQLIEDFREAARHVPEPSDFLDQEDPTNPAELEDIAQVERYLFGTPQKLSEILRIEKIVLPPLEKLTLAQAGLLSEEMTTLLGAYHFVPVFPENLPGDIRYRVLRDNWESEQVYVGAGDSYIEFCQYEPKECPFPSKYCSCLKFDGEEDDDSDWPDEGLMEDSDLPF